MTEYIKSEKELSINKRGEDFITLLQQHISIKEEDLDQRKLVEFVQHNRTMLLEGAMRAYLQNPNKFDLLRAINPLMDSIEKSVREDRKERFKQKELETTGVHFKDLIESLKYITKEIEFPVPKTNLHILNPNLSILDDVDNIKPITQEELSQGIIQIDVNGEVV